MKRRMKMELALLLTGVVLAGCTPREVVKAPQATWHETDTVAMVFPTESRTETGEKVQVPSWVDVQLIPVHGVARRGEKLEKVKNIVIHYTGNPGTTAQNNRDFFASEQSEVSSHFVIGLEGEIIQCVPLDEKSSASNHRNKDTISIETCHPDATGEFTKATYEAEVRLAAWLCEAYGLTEQEVIRHYDVTGKICPKYYVENEEAWEAFLEDVRKVLEGK